MRPAAPLPPRTSARYRDLSLLARGGMATVWRAWDTRMDREVALKVMDGAQPVGARARFLREVRLVAGMDHPAIVPVHDAGVLRDGRPWFTMKLIHGRTLGEAATDPGWDLRRRVDALQRVALAVAWAHAWRGGVLHRDLKPANILVGAYGEVYVLDWGVAILRAAAAEAAFGAGTPLFLAPEARWIPPEELDARIDVYSLGAILRALIQAAPGTTRVGGAETRAQGVPLDKAPPDVRAAAPRRGLATTWAPRAGDLVPPAPPAPGGPAGAPEELIALCVEATAADPARRPATAALFAARLGGWLDGTERRARALEWVAAAKERIPQREELGVEAEAAAQRAGALLDGVPAWAPPRERLGAWALEDTARALRAERDALDDEREEALQAALRLDPELPEAHAELAALYRARHGLAEGRRDWTGAAVLERLVARHDRAGRHTDWLEGVATLTLATTPPGAEVFLFRSVPHGRRSVARFVARLGVTPLDRVRVPHGAATLLVRAPGREPVRLPLRVGRAEAWRLIPPGGDTDLPLPLLPRGLGPSARYVPAGWYRAGGDDDAPDALPARSHWVDGFVIQRFPVTVLQYFEFLDALVAAGRVDEAVARAPTRRRDEGRATAPCWRWDAGRIAPDFRDAHVSFDAAWPITNIGHADARAYATWLAERTGRPWRLPHDLEWEKAARGADGRPWPWGDGFDPAFASMAASHEQAPERVPVTAFAFDRSPYGVRGLGGNVRDWCANAYARDGAPAGRLDPEAPGGEARYRVVRGGAWLSTASQCRAAARFAAVPDARTGVYGVRLVWSVAVGGS